MRSIFSIDPSLLRIILLLVEFVLRLSVALHHVAAASGTVIEAAVVSPAVQVATANEAPVVDNAHSAHHHGCSRSSSLSRSRGRASGLINEGDFVVIAAGLVDVASLDGGGVVVVMVVRVHLATVPNVRRRL